MEKKYWICSAKYFLVDDTFKKISLNFDSKENLKRLNECLKQSELENFQQLAKWH